MSNLVRGHPEQARRVKRVPTLIGVPREHPRTYWPPSPGGSAGLGLRGNAALTVMVVIAVLMLTGFSVGYMHKVNHATDAQRFNTLTVKIRGEILRQVNVYRFGLFGTRSVFAASQHVDRGEFEQIVGSRDVADEFPAATGMGYIDRVPREEVPAYVAASAEDGWPQFAVRTLNDPTAYDHNYIIKYIEPADQNAAAIGLDIGSEQRRRAAAERAMREGDVALTEQITLVQATGGGPGFLILLPFYDGEQMLETPEQREAALRGWVYMTILSERMFHGLAHDVVNGELDFRVFDSAEMSPDLMLYGGGDGEYIDEGTDLLFSDRAHHELIPVEIGGRSWMVAMGSSHRFAATPGTGLWAVGVGGVLLALLLALLVQAQSSSLHKAQSIAHAMTLDLRHAAMTDRLTGLPNRTAIMEKVQDAISRAQRVKDYHYAVLFLDFDRFKVINDSLGHNAGDLLLQEIGRRLTDTLRPHDAAGLGSERNIAARLGGDEFIVLLDGLTAPEDALVVAERMLGVLAERYTLGGRTVGSTASIGVVIGDAEYSSADDVIRDADTAMYEAKRAGRGDIKVFDRPMRVRAKEQLDIENRLHLAIEKEEFRLNYQPIVSLKTGQLESFEALVRWEHPKEGMIGPDRFIPVAEETGMIVPLGQWVLDRALEDYRRWREDGLIPDNCDISVNLSRKQLIMPNLFDTVNDALRRHHVQPGHLHLEVTESEIMQDAKTATENLQKLRRLGVQIDIDDFGTGYSSLACLHEFPLDVLKIDRAFIANLTEDLGLVAVLRTVAELARNLGVQVVAEGIETAEQLALLQSLDCEFGQGYFFSRPLAEPAVREFCLEARRPAA